MCLVIVMFVTAAAMLGMAAIAGLDVKLVAYAAQPQLNDSFRVQRVVFWLRHWSPLLDKVAHGAVPYAAAQNHVDSSNTMSQPATASALLANGLAVDDGSIGHFPDEQV